MNKVQLGTSDLHVTPICLGTMTFGEQVNEADSHAILSCSLDAGINFIDTAEMYSVPAKAETCGATETIIGNWFEKNPGVRQKLVLATKVAGPSRGMPWIREGSGMTAQDILNSCEGSLRRLKTDVIDLYQIHWPERHVPVFGMSYFDPSKDKSVTSIHEQLEALAKLVKAGKVRYIGLSNETPYGVHEFIRLAEQHGTPRIATVQNLYNLTARWFETSLMDEACYREGVSLLAYSPLAFGQLSAKYLDDPQARGRLTIFPPNWSPRYVRPAVLAATAEYAALARANGLRPAQMALAWCYTRSFVASTIIGATSLEQLAYDIDAYSIKLPEDVMNAVNEVHLDLTNPGM